MFKLPKLIKLKPKKPVIVAEPCDHKGKLEFTEIPHPILGTELISECSGCGHMWRH